MVIVSAVALTRSLLVLNPPPPPLREESIDNPRVQAVLREIRVRAGDRAANSEQGWPAVKAADWASYKVHIVSENNFPTAAGLASSAAGYACMGTCDTSSCAGTVTVTVTQVCLQLCM